MALTPQEQRNAARVFVQRAFAEKLVVANIHVGELLGAIVAFDSWLDAAPVAAGASNLVQMVTALPAPFRSGTNASQKSLLVAVVALARGGAL